MTNNSFRIFMTAAYFKTEIYSISITGAPGHFSLVFKPFFKFNTAIKNNSFDNKCENYKIAQTEHKYLVKNKKMVHRTNLFYLFSEIIEIVKLLVFLKKFGNNRRIRTNFLNSIIYWIFVLCFSYL